ncbi:unnamed protein product [Cylindrotheca closterium]|uniref:Uncharacterized protein n=1 Tax=Cylindrotheca closterium TaxID=2856 RepID=A0AAD2JK09_9STRA|nr:unnamed protein product [Cylindrotheca closterium]
MASVVSQVKSQVRNSNEEKASTKLTIVSGILFVFGCSFYVIGTTLNLPSNNATNAWMYNAIGAGVFTMCGLVEYFNYMGGFHVFLIFAGIFGLTAEILDGHGNPVSVHFNFLANHMYFCEAVKLYIAHSGDFYAQAVANKIIMIKTLRYADILFLSGTVIDIILAWIYLFTGTPNSGGAIASSSSTGGSGGSLNLLRTDDQKNAELASASLWFICSILTLMVYIRMARAETSANGREEVGDEKDNTNLSEVV